MKILPVKLCEGSHERSVCSSSEPQPLHTFLVALHPRKKKNVAVTLPVAFKLSVGPQRNQIFFFPFPRLLCFSPDKAPSSRWAEQGVGLCSRGPQKCPNPSPGTTSWTCALLAQPETRVSITLLPVPRPNPPRWDEPGEVFTQRASVRLSARNEPTNLAVHRIRKALFAWALSCVVLLCPKQEKAWKQHSFLVSQLTDLSRKSWHLVCFGVLF